jgi:transcriptional regulator with XRE-family HTH domain
MPRERELDATLSPLAFFGAEVRRARTAAGMSLADLGQLVPCDKSTVSRVESGLLAPDEAFARACDGAFPSAGGWFTRFFAAHAKWEIAMPPAFRSFVADEARATALYTFEHSLIPGLLASEDYSRAVLSRHLGASVEQVTARVAARMARQAILDREDPPLLWAVIDDAALSRCVGSPEVMRDALAHLTGIAARPNVTVQVIADAGAHVGLQGAFTVAEITGSACSVNIEDIADGRVCDDAATVGTAAVRFRWLQSEAMSAAASQAFIERMAEQWTQAAPGGAHHLTPVPAAGSASK